MSLDDSKVLPAGWSWGSVSDLCDVNPSTPVDHIEPEQLVSFVPMAAVGELNGKIDTSQSRSLASVAKGFTKFARGDIIIAKITPCMENGKAAIIPDVPFGVAFGSTEFHVLRPKIPSAAGYLFYYLTQEGIRSRAKRAMTGAVGQQRVSRDFIASLPMPIAPPNEQKRIVAKIEELFGEIEAGEQELARAREALERYRRSVLKAAVTGDLTRDWRAKNPSKETGADLLACILKERRAAWERTELAKLQAKGKAPKDDGWKKRYVEPRSPETSELPKLPVGWVWASWDQILTDIEAGLNFKCVGRPPEEDEIGIVKVSAVTWDEFDESESKTVTDKARVDASLYIRAGDFLFSRANTLELVGAAVVVRSISKRLMLSDKILRFHFAWPLQEWGYLFLKSPLGRHEIEKRSTGAQLSMRNITQEGMRSLPIPIPPLKELEELIPVARASLEGQVEALAQLCAIDGAANSARQSILAAAFSGRLVVQSANDEPAATPSMRGELPLSRRARAR